MKTKFLYILFFIVATAQQAVAQVNTSSFGSNVDPDMLQRGDTIGRSIKNVPASVYCWTIDEIYGNIRPTLPDTVHHQYQNNSHSEGLNGHYNTLGNLGSPRQNRIFMEREPMPSFIFLDAYSQFFTPTEKFRHYNTKSPYMNLAYNWFGSKNTGYDNFTGTYTQNIGKKANFGAEFKYMYGLGYYNQESTSQMSTRAWTSYIGDKYNAHFYYMHNYMKMAENGGITDERYITDPVAMGESYATQDYPTNLSNTWTRQEHDIAFLNHHYNIGFYRTEIDSTKKDSVKEIRTFIPVTKFFHTIKFSKFMRNYVQYRESGNFHEYSFYPSDSVDDVTKSYSIRNNVGISLCEGFQKWAAFGLNAYIGYEYRNFSLPDTLVSSFGSSSSRQSVSRYSENYFCVGGQLIRTQGSLIHYNVNAEFALGDKDQLGTFDVNGHGEINIPMFRDTTQIAVNAYIKNQNPSFYFRHYHSGHARWDQDISKEWRMRLEGVISNKRTKTRLTVGFENIKNYAYFENNGGIRPDSASYYSNVNATSCSSAIQVISANLRQDFVLGPVHLDTDVTYQYSSNQDVLPLPTVSLYGNLYLDFRIAKVLHCELGADVKYFTEYYAPDYSPVVSQFTTQNPNKKVKIGNYPIVSAYANFHLKRLRFYVQYYHANQSEGRYFTVPYYPLSPQGLRFGLNWNFYD